VTTFPTTSHPAQRARPAKRARFALTAAIAAMAVATAGSTATATAATTATATIATTATAATTSAVAPVVAADRPEADRIVRGADIARVLFYTRATARPAGGRVLAALAPTAPHGGGPTQLRVVAQRVIRGALRVRVLLPQRPNGAAGWISGDDVALLQTPYRVWIDRAKRTVAVTFRGRRVKRFAAVVGRSQSPTPAGQFAISELLAQRPSHPLLGGWVIPLTAFSGTYLEFGGGPGRIAIHGRAGALLGDPLGSAASHGCIRIANEAIAWIAHRVPSGAAVTIR